MRPELREYNLDWMLWKILDIASKTKDGTDKEFDRLLDYIPHFKGSIGPFMAQGKAGETLLQIFKKYMENIVTAHEKGKKLAMTTFCFCPAIFYAMDVVPVTLEVLTVASILIWKRGTSDFLDYCVEAGFTETSCSAQRGSLGAYLAGLCENIDFIVCDSAGVCDTNANAYAFTSAYLNKPMFQLNYPPTLVDERARTYHLNDYKGLISFIENQTGKKLEPDRLRMVLEETRKQDDLIAELEEIQRIVPNPLPTLYNFFNYAGRFTFAGLPESTELLYDLLETAKKNADAGASGLSSGKEKARALFCYIDHYTIGFRLWDWLDKHGISHLGSMLSRFCAKDAPYLAGDIDGAYGIDTSTMDSMIYSMADLNAKMPMVRSIRGPYDSPHMWVDGVLSTAKILKASCIIYNGTPGCRNTWGMVKLFARDTEKHGFPTLIMYADGFDDRVQSWESTAERLDEFFRVRKLI